MLGPLAIRHRCASLSSGSTLALLDRDGVLVENRAGYVRAEADVAVLPEGQRRLELLARAGIPVGIVTSQACIGKEIIDARRAIEIHEHVLDTLGEAARCVAATYICPHRADEGCYCRKPAPGLLRAALVDHATAPRDAFLIGDAIDDVEAACAAQVRAYVVQRSFSTTASSVEYRLNSSQSSSFFRSDASWSDSIPAAFWSAGRTRCA